VSDPAADLREELRALERAYTIGHHGLGVARRRAGLVDACLVERSKRRSDQGVNENLAARDERDSQRAAAPLMIPLGAMIINNSGETPEQTSTRIIAEVEKRLIARQ